ncbi:hypothetical protein DIPPA_58035 [Diplonema papillatum]|nr:hypothetical protein DIPPA_58035 [Diplonema papillatum]
MRCKATIALIAVVGTAYHTVLGCSTLAVGRNATTDGSVLTSHSNDGSGDSIGNLVRIQAAHYPAGSVRPPGVPQVNYTYAYHREGGGYAAMNEHQVGMSESTCSAYFTASHSTALLNIVDLSQIGLERATTAREAISVMGELAVEYGFYGDTAQDGAGESLMVSDPREAWIFQISPDSSQRSAVWAAQRVPDGHVAAVMNCFTIRNITLSDTQNFMVSTTIETAAAHRMWVQGPLLDFALLFSAGEAGHKYACGRRMWGAYHLLAPAHAFSPEYDDFVQDAPYPATVAVAASSVDLAAVANVMRYQYQETQFDLTKGLAAGPFGAPDRWQVPTTIPGWWERAIGIYKSIVSYITQARSFLPNEIGGALWFAPHAAHTSCYTPFPVGMNLIPLAYNSSTSTLDRTKAFWVHRILLNIAQIKYSYMIVDIKETQAMAETASRMLQQKTDQEFLAHRNLTAVSEAFLRNANSVVQTFANLSDSLIQKYPDGYCNGCGHNLSHVLGYPQWWLSDVNYSAPLQTQQPSMLDVQLCTHECPELSVAAYKECVARCFDFAT